MAVSKEWIERESRSARLVKAVVSGEEGDDASATILNISRRGCCIRTGRSFAVGEMLRIVVPRLGAVSARVRWSRKGACGAEFAAGSDSWESPAEDPDADHTTVSISRSYGTGH